MGQPQIRAGQPRPEPEAARPRLCRHLLFASLRPGHAARRNDDGARPGGALGPGALCRHLVLQFAANARSRHDPARARHAAAHPPAELFDDQPLGRGRRPARHARRPGRRIDRLHAAGAGNADRQVSDRHSRRAAAPRKANRCVNPSSTRPRSPTFARSTRSPASAARRWRRWRSPGCCAKAASLRR